MVKLTADLVVDSPQFINTVLDRELNLRGWKIPVIENIGATNNQFDSIDLAHNDIKRLENFPVLPRLKNLFLPCNRILYIQPDIHKYLPSLTTLSLMNNNLQELGDLLPLKACQRLTYLHLLGNPLTKKANYRYYVIYCLPQVRVLDFRRIKQQERDTAKKLFKGKKGAELRKVMSKTTVKVFTPGEMGDSIPVAALDDIEMIAGVGGPAIAASKNPAEVQRIKDAIANAKTLAEVEHLKNLLASGQVPSSQAEMDAAKKKNPDVEMEEEEDEETEQQATENQPENGSAPPEDQPENGNENGKAPEPEPESVEKENEESGPVEETAMEVNENAGGVEQEAEEEEDTELQPEQEEKKEEPVEGESAAADAEEQSL